MTYDQDEISRSLGRIEGRLDALIAAQDSAAFKCGQCTVRFENLETQMQTHKTFFWALGGFATLVGGERLLSFFHFTK